MPRRYVVTVLVCGLSRVLLEWDWFAVKVTSDQARLAQIAMEAGSWEVCKDAIEKLTDQVLLKKIATEDAIGFVRGAAKKRQDELQGTLPQSGVLEATSQVQK